MFKLNIFGKKGENPGRKRKKEDIFQNAFTAFYDAILFLPIADLEKDGKTVIREKRGIHVAIIYGRSRGVATVLDLPKEFLKWYYEMTLNVNNGNPEDRIVYFGAIYYSYRDFVRKRAEFVKKLGKVTPGGNAKFLYYPRWIWLTLENAKYKNQSYFVVNSFDDDTPFMVEAGLEGGEKPISDKTFDNFGAVGMVHDKYVLFASVARKQYVELVNKQISYGITKIIR